MQAPPNPLRRLCLVLGDQLDCASAIFDAFDPAQDAILMCEAAEEALYIAQHKRRIAFFFSAMRHFAEDQRSEGRFVIYRQLDEEGAPQTLADAMAEAFE